MSVQFRVPLPFSFLTFASLSAELVSIFAGVLVSTVKRITEVEEKYAGSF